MLAMHVVRPQGAETPHPALERFARLLDMKVVEPSPLSRIPSNQVCSLLLDLAFAAVELLQESKPRISVPLPIGQESWELGLEANGPNIFFSVFRHGPVPEVHLYNYVVSVHDLKAGLGQCLALLASGSQLSMTERTSLGRITRRLNAQGSPLPLALHRGYSAKGRIKSCNMWSELQLRTGTEDLASDSTGQLECADLHSLLAEGTLCFEHLDRPFRMESAQLFLDAERLLNLATEALDAWRALAPTFRRAQLSQGRLTMRKGPGEGRLQLRLNRIPAGSEPAFVFELQPREFINLTTQFCLSLSEAFYKSDSAQKRNLRLTSLVNHARHVQQQCAATEADESLSNPNPDSYRRFVPRMRRTKGTWDSGGKMRFAARWVATMPAIDLKSTYLCGDQIMVGGANETACLDRRSGHILWRQPLPHAASVVTPAGLVRIEPDGLLSCHDLGTGEVRFSQRTQPRTGTGPSGSVLYGPGLPRLLALTEGDRQVSGIDLMTGEIRWRYTSRRPGNFRLRRTGRLILVAGGDPLLVALDGATGQVVWRLRSRLPFTGDISLSRDSAYALSGNQSGSWCLHEIDPWTGQERWCTELPERPLPGRAPLITPDCVIVPTIDEKGAGACAFKRATGSLAWSQAPGLTDRATSWLAVDDRIIANSSAGTILGLSANEGHVCYNHVFSSTPDSDTPRRLEPVLRNGALFVPQSQVHVLRPKDGELLGSLPSDLVPDLIRVDENCHVYIAEESGHLAAFGAAPRLALVS